MGYVRKYGRDDVEYEDWYSAWSKQLAKNYTLKELEIMSGTNTGELAHSTKQHLGAVQKTTSMTSNSQGRASSRSNVTLHSLKQFALNGAIEIYELFPEFTRESGDYETN